MTLASAALGHNGPSFDSKHFRQLIADLADSGLSIVPSVFSGFKVSQQTSPAGTVRVAAGRLVLPATTAGLTGAYSAWNDASVDSPTITATSTNGRKDRLILRVTSGVPALEIVAGTPAGVPAEPTITGDNYIELALITMPPSTSNVTDAFITDRRVFGGKWAQPWGEVAFASTTSDTPNGTGGTPVDTPLVATWVATANRKYKTTIQGHVYSSVQDTLVHVTLADGAGVAKNRWDRESTQPNFAEFFSATHREVGLGAGSATRTVRIHPQVAGGIAHFFADSVRIAQILVEDIGPSANPD